MSKSLKESEEQMLSIGDTAKLIPAHVNTLRRWADKGIIPCHRFGGQRGMENRKFKKSDIELVRFNSVELVGLVRFDF